MLARMFRTPESKVLSPSALAAKVAELRAQGKRIVTTNGCFDLLHWGHIHCLAEARKLGDVLIVGLNSDASVRGLKGPSRPLVEEGTRLKQIAGLESVDFVSLFFEGTPEKFLETVRPAVHVKGGDYESGKMPERTVVEKHGGTIQIIPQVPGFSTTALIGKITSS